MLLRSLFLTLLCSAVVPVDCLEACGICRRHRGSSRRVYKPAITPRYTPQVVPNVQRFWQVQPQPAHPQRYQSTTQYQPTPHYQSIPQYPNTPHPTVYPGGVRPPTIHPSPGLVQEPQPQAPQPEGARSQADAPKPLAFPDERTTTADPKPSPESPAPVGKAIAQAPVATHDRRRNPNQPNHESASGDGRKPQSVVTPRRSANATSTVENESRENPRILAEEPASSRTKGEAGSKALAVGQTLISKQSATTDEPQLSAIERMARENFLLSSFADPTVSKTIR